MNMDSDATSTFESEEDAIPSLLNLLEPNAANDGDDEDTEPQGSQADADDAEEAPEDGEQDAQDADEDTEDEADEAPAAAKTYKVKVDGEEIEVTESELLAGYSRDADYRRKTQALAEERRQLQGAKQQLMPIAQDYLAKLEEVEQALAAFAPQEIDWERFRSENPAEFPAAYAEYLRNKELLSGVQQERMQAMAEYQQLQQEAFNAHLQEQKARLVELVPEWKDASVASTEMRAIVDFAMNDLGFTQDEVAQVYDARLVRLLRMAKQYQDSITRRPAVKAKAEQIIKTAKPGPAAVVKAQKVQGRVAKVREKARRTGSVDDAAAAILNMGLHR